MPVRVCRFTNVGSTNVGSTNVGQPPVDHHLKFISLPPLWPTGGYPPDSSPRSCCGSFALQGEPQQVHFTSQSTESNSRYSSTPAWLDRHHVNRQPLIAHPSHFYLGRHISGSAFGIDSPLLFSSEFYSPSGFAHLGQLIPWHPRLSRLASCHVLGSWSGDASVFAKCLMACSIHSRGPHGLSHHGRIH